jgi:hypothetical protein
MIRDSESKGNNINGFLGGGAIALAILAGVMGLTNPPRDEYIHYASDALSEELKKNQCKESKVPEFLREFSGDLVDFCETAIGASKVGIKSYLDNSTKRQNALIFSLYTTELFGRRYQTLGAFGNFLTFSSENVEKK